MPGRSHVAAILLTLTVLAAACGSAAAPSGDSVIGLEYQTFDGETEAFGDRRGTPLVINFFAEWCPNCVAEMPDFEVVAQQLAGEVDFVGISIDKASGDALALVEETGVTYDIGWDPTEELLTGFRSLAMPTTVFVAADGTVSRVWSGGLDADGLTDLINEEIL